MGWWCGWGFGLTWWQSWLLWIVLALMPVEGPPKRPRDAEDEPEDPPVPDEAKTSNVIYLFPERDAPAQAPQQRKART